jgi:predicted GH43/DUF377 family glycosyl hydrolase
MFSLMSNLFLLLSVLFLPALGYVENKIVLSTKRIYFDEFPSAYNPSIVKTDTGFLLAFRYSPSRDAYSHISYIGIVPLDESLEPTARPQLLKIRPKNSKTIAQAEDPRFFSYKGRLFLIYNDNIEIPIPNLSDRRDMFIAELFCNDGFYSISTPCKLIYEEVYKNVLWQKNWMPFEYKGMMLLIYSINPHEIIAPNLANGSCFKYSITEPDIDWNWGPLRGSSSPLLDDGEYLVFFHSGMKTSSPSSWGYELWHYYMGAYTFSPEPPFAITKFSASPIIADGFYTQSSYYKRIIFPGGYVIAGPHIYMAYGKDDCEMWIATLDKQVLKNSLIPVEFLMKKKQ